MDNGNGRKLLVALMAGLTVVIVGVCVFLIMGRDKTPPEVTISDDAFTYNQGMSREELLAGVTASDDHDGDVTDQIIVEGVTVSEDGTTASITYAVTDSSKNVTKKVREVPCGDGTGQQESAASTEDSQTQEDAQASADGEASTDTQKSQDSQNAQDTQKKNVTATNGQNAETEEESEDAETTTEPVNPEAPVITLTDKELTISRGSGFTALKYVENITDDKDDRKRLYNNIEIKGHVDTSTSGEYVLTYFVTDSDGNRSNEAELKVTVQ